MDYGPRRFLYDMTLVGASALSIFMGLTYWVLMLVFYYSWSFFWSCFWYSLICLLAPFMAWATLSEWHKYNDMDSRSN